MKAHGLRWVLLAGGSSATIQQEQMILSYIDKHGSIRRAEAMELCRITKDQAYKLLSRLKNKEEIEQSGERKRAVYKRKR